YSHTSTRVAAIGTSTRSIRGTAPLAGASGSRGGQRDTTLDARTEVGIGAVVNVSTTSGAGRDVAVVRRWPPLHDASNATQRPALTTRRRVTGLSMPGRAAERVVRARRVGFASACERRSADRRTRRGRQRWDFSTRSGRPRRLL